MKTIDLNTYQKLIRQAQSLPVKKHRHLACGVATALLTYVNFKSGRCDPSESTLAKDLDICERSVRNGLLALSEAGLIRIGKRKGRTNQYDLLFINPGKREHEPRNERSTRNESSTGKFEQGPRQIHVDTPASLSTDPGKFEQELRNEHATEQMKTHEITNESTNEENSKTLGEEISVSIKLDSDETNKRDSDSLHPVGQMEKESNESIKLTPMEETIQLVDQVLRTERMADWDNDVEFRIMMDTRTKMFNRLIDQGRRALRMDDRSCLMQLAFQIYRLMLSADHKEIEFVDFEEEYQTTSNRDLLSIVEYKRSFRF